MSTLEISIILDHLTYWPVSGLFTTTYKYIWFQRKPESAMQRQNSKKILPCCQWTVPQLSVMIIYNSTWFILIQQTRIILACDNLTQKTQKKDPFKNLHKIKANLPHWAKFEILRNGASTTTLHVMGLAPKYCNLLYK